MARYFIVVETSGNVFEIWEKTATNKPIEIASECERHFISVEEAVGLILYTIVGPRGRYIVNSNKRRNMGDIADVLYPDREKKYISPRTGDRICELFKSSSEVAESLHLGGAVIKLTSIHDCEQ